jgi:hypothetical protein
MKVILLVNASFLAGIFISILVYIGIPTVLDEKHYDLASPLAILISASIALISAFISIFNNNKHSREKNTIDVIGQGKGEIGEEYLFIKRFLRENRGNEAEALKYLARHNIKFTEMHPIISKLNELEHLCEGMFKGFYNESIIKNTRGSAIIRIWELLSPYMNERRKIQQEKTLVHKAFTMQTENQPFYWLEQAYVKFTKESLLSKDNVLPAVVMLTFIAYLIAPVFMLMYFHSVGLNLTS